MAVDKRIWIGFDLGGTKMLCQVFDAEFNPLGRHREKTRGHEGAEAGMATHHRDDSQSPRTA